MWFGLFFFGTPKGTRNTKESFGQALASGAHPRRILLFESLPSYNIKSRYPFGYLLLMARQKGLEPPTLGTGIRCSIH